MATQTDVADRRWCRTTWWRSPNLRSLHDLLPAKRLKDTCAGDRRPERRRFRPFHSMVAEWGRDIRPPTQGLLRHRSSSQGLIRSLWPYRWSLGVASGRRRSDAPRRLYYVAMDAWHREHSHLRTFDSSRVSMVASAGSPGKHLARRCRGALPPVIRRGPPRIVWTSLQDVDIGFAGRPTGA